MKTRIKHLGEDCDCYGKLEDNSNFELVFADENLDCVWAEGNPRNSEFTFSSWLEVVKILSSIHGAVPVQIEAV